MRLPTVAPDSCAGAESGRVVIPGGQQPDFGPADVNPPPPPCKVNCEPPPCKDCKPPVIDEIAVVLPKSAKLKNVAKKGFALKVTVPGAGKVSVTARLGGKKAGSGKTTTPGASTATVTVRLTKKAAAQLRKAKKPALSLAVTYVPVGGGQKVTKTINLKVKK
jgi:hypothetical protein